MKVTVLTHVDFEGPAGIGLWAEARGHGVEVVRLHRGERLPEVAGVGLLAVMGGPMNIYEQAEHPWLEAEKRFLKLALQAGVPAVGICFGAQLLADALGANVMRNGETEIGIFPVALSGTARATDLFSSWPEVFEVLHWHGDTFAIPPGTIPLGSSEATANQGFVYRNKVVGLQFHPEATPASWDGLIGECGAELGDGRYVQTATEMRAGYDRVAGMRAHLNDLLDRLAAKA